MTQGDPQDTIIEARAERDPTYVERMRGLAFALGFERAPSDVARRKDLVAEWAREAIEFEDGRAEDEGPTYTGPSSPPPRGGGPRPDRTRWTRLREDQIGFLEALERHASEENEAPIATTVQPGASGKTTMMMRFLIAAIDRMKATRTCANVVLLAPTKIILRQLRDKARELGMDPVHVNVDGARGVGLVTMMSHARFCREVEAGRIDPDDVDVLLIDEAHRMLSKRRIEAIDRFFGRTFVVGATASPTFNATKNLDRVFAERNRIWNVTHERMREIGAIATTTNIIVDVDISGPIPDDPVEAALRRRQAIAEATVELLSGRAAGVDLDLTDQTFLFYGQDVAGAKMMAESYEAERIARRVPRTCTAICGLDEREFIVDTMERLEEGEIAGVANVILVGEGYDLPKIRVVVNSPTSSKVRETQQGARAQRVDHDDPEGGSHCYVVDMRIIENGVPRGRPLRYYEVVELSVADEVPLKYTYDTRTEHADLAPYRGMRLTHDNAIDGSDAANARQKHLQRIPEAPVMSQLIYNANYRIEHLGRLTRAALAEMTEDDIDVTLCVALARQRQVKASRVRSAFRIMELSLRENASSIALSGLRMRPMTMLRKGTPTTCINPGEAEMLIAALADEDDSRTRDKATETYTAGPFMRTLYSVPSPEVERTFLEDARTAYGLNRPLTLLDGARLPLRVEGIEDEHGRRTPTVLFPRVDAPRVAEHLGLVARSCDVEPPIGEDDVTIDLFRSLDGTSRRDTPFARSAWLRFSQALREDTECSFKTGNRQAVAVHPRLVATRRGAEIAIPRSEAMALAAMVWGGRLEPGAAKAAAAEAPKAGRTTPTAEAVEHARRHEEMLASTGGPIQDGERSLNHLWSGKHLPVDEYGRSQERKVRHFVKFMKEDLLRDGFLRIGGHEIRTRMARPDGRSVAIPVVSAREAEIMLRSFGVTDDGRPFLTQEEASGQLKKAAALKAKAEGRKPKAGAGAVPDGMWKQLAADWREGIDGQVGGVKLRGYADGRGRGVKSGLHPDDVEALARCMEIGE